MTPYTFTPDEFHVFSAMAPVPDDQEQWILERLRRYPDQCLAIAQVPWEIWNDNEYEGQQSFIFYCLQMCDEGDELRMVWPLLDQALAMGVSLESLRYEGGNLLHWIVGACDEQEGLPMVELLLKSNFTVYDRDLGDEECYTAVSWALEAGSPQILERLLQHYDQQHFEAERAQWDDLLPPLHHADLREKLHAVIVQREAQLLSEALPQDVDPAKNHKMRL